MPLFKKKKKGAAGGHIYTNAMAANNCPQGSEDSTDAAFDSGAIEAKNEPSIPLENLIPSSVKNSATFPTAFEQPPIRELSDSIPLCDNFHCNWVTSDGSCGCWGAERYQDICDVTDCCYAGICYACQKSPCRKTGLRTMKDKRSIEKKKEDEGELTGNQEGVRA